MEPEYLSPKEVEAMFSISEKTLAQWRWQKRGPDFVKYGGKVLYKVSDLRDFFENYRVRCYRPGEV